LSEDVMLFGLDLSSAQELRDLIGSAGYEADEPRHERGGNPQSGEHEWDEFAVYGAILRTGSVWDAVTSVMVTWSVDMALAEPLDLRPPGIGPPLVIINYHERERELLIALLALIAPHAAIVDNLFGIVLPGSQFAEKLRDPDLNWYGSRRSERSMSSTGPDS
jgi:hypothetical protein